MGQVNKSAFKQGILQNFLHPLQQDDASFPTGGQLHTDRIPGFSNTRKLLEHPNVWEHNLKGGYGAMAARLTPDQKVGRSNRSGLI